MIAMRLGPGKHLKGRTLMNGTVTPEEFDYFHEVRLLPYLLPELVGLTPSSSSSSTQNSLASERVGSSMGC